MKADIDESQTSALESRACDNYNSYLCFFHLIKKILLLVFLNELIRQKTKNVLQRKIAYGLFHTLFDTKFDGVES